MATTFYQEIFVFIDNICAKLGTKAYLWGGWIPDVYIGKILRQHKDADYLVVDLYRYRSNIQRVFDSLWWETTIVANGDLVVKKDKIKIHFGHLEISMQKAIWFHNGLNGQIIFPKQWLNNRLVQLHNYSFHAVRPEFQYVLKIHPEYMRPSRTQRDIDRADLEVLKKLLILKKINLKSIENKMFCKNNEI